MITFNLEDSYAARLLLVLGYQMGTARKNDDDNMAAMILDVTNEIGRQIPGYLGISMEPEKAEPNDPVDRPDERI